MLYDDPEDDLGDDVAPEERAMHHHNPFPDHDDVYDDDVMDFEFIAELREFDEAEEREKEAERQRRSAAAKWGWYKRRRKKKVRKELRTLDAEWDV